MATRFISYGWNVTRVGDANDLEMLDRAFTTFKKTTGRPTLIIVDSHIGYRAPTKQDTHAARWAARRRRSARRFYGWPEDAKFLVPDGVREQFAAGIGARGAKLRNEWLARFEAAQGTYPDEAEALSRMQRRQLPDGWEQAIPNFRGSQGAARTRRVGAGSQRRRATHSLVDWRVRRPRSVYEDATHVRRRRRFRSRLV